jgi:predicted Fe-Mo cluster-binding NifX family protein
MKIAVSSKGAGLGAWLEPDLEKCGFLMIVDEIYHFEAIENKNSEIDLAREAVASGATALVAGRLQDSTRDFLLKNHIALYCAHEGSVLELVEKTSAGELNPLT